MERASHSLPPIISSPDGLSIHFLTGKNYLYQTLFCIQSLAKVTKTKFRFVLIDDGSFDTKLIKPIYFQLPGAQIVTRPMIEQNLKNSLPQKLYPYLHQKRKVYPHLKKLTDIHTIPGSDWKLVLDSDMLFLAEPTEIINWLQSPTQPLHMVDCEESYGYSVQLMENLSQSAIIPLINVGAIGLSSNQMNWDNLENWSQTLEEREGACYYLEQAISAMIIGDKAATILNNEKYIVNPSAENIIKKSGVLHHYVDLSKEGYFRYAWKEFINE